ncbi:hypothetical protein [Luteibacter jiangsuensis]
MANTSPSTADNAFPRLRKGRRLKADGVWRDTRAAAAQKRAFIQAINGGALENGTFVPVDVDPVIPDALDIIGNPDVTDEAKKVIPVSLADGEITVECEPWANAADGDQAAVVVLPPGGDPENLVDPVIGGVVVIDTSTTITMTLDLTQLGVLDGQDLPFDLYVFQWRDFSNPAISNVYKFRVDKQKPGGNFTDFTHLYIPDDYIANGVTLAQLQAAGGFDCSITAYYAFAEDDIVSVVVTTSDGSEFTYEAGAIPADTHKLDIKIPVSFFIDNAIDGTITVAPKARDVAGNENTGLSHELETLIAGSPTGFQPLLVPLHDDDNVINLADSRTPPEFTIAAYLTPLAGDQIEVTINNVSAAIFPVDTSADPVVTGTIPTASIVAAGAGTNGLFNFVLNYRLLRGKFTIPSNMPKTIECDLRASGWGTSLVKGVVRGPNSTDDDVIPPEDSTGPLTATVPHLALDGTEAFVTNDRVIVYKVNMDGSNPVAIGVPQSATQGTDLAYNVNANALVDGVNYVRYDNLRANQGGEDNTEVSPIWPVEVTSSSGLPGGGTPIPVSVWLFRDARQIIFDPTNAPDVVQPAMNYRRANGNVADGSRFAGVILRIHFYTNMAQGDRINVTIEGYNNQTATGTPDFTETLPEYEVTAADVSGTKATAIPEDSIGTEFPPYTQLPLPQPEEARFADIKIPYDPTILRLAEGGVNGRGSLRVSYTVTNSHGTGASDPSTPVFLRVDARPPTSA